MGYSVAQILKEDGYNVIKTQIINDRGIHICKSMLAWEKFGNAETPKSTNTKGDKFVGNYYVEFDNNYKSEITDLKEGGQSEDEAKKNAPLILEAQKMLLDWEKGDEKVRKLWNEMNSWVYEVFGETYKRLGVDFDQVQYESNTYLPVSYTHLDVYKRQGLTDLPTRIFYPTNVQTLNTANYQAASTAIGGDKMNTKLIWDKN